MNRYENGNTYVTDLEKTPSRSLRKPFRAEIHKEEIGYNAVNPLNGKNLKTGYH